MLTTSPPQNKASLFRSLIMDARWIILVKDQGQDIRIKISIILFGMYFVYIEEEMSKSGLKNVKKHTINTAAIQAIRWKGHGVPDTRKFTLMYSSNDSNTFGTSLLINKKYKKAIMYFEVVDERLCSLRTRRAFNNFRVISVHRSTKEKDKLIKDSLHIKIRYMKEFQHLI